GALREVKHFCARDGGGGVIPEGRDVAQVERPAGLPATRGEGHRIVHDLLSSGGHFIHSIYDLIHGPIVAELGSGGNVWVGRRCRCGRMAILRMLQSFLAVASGVGEMVPGFARPRKWSNERRMCLGGRHRWPESSTSARWRSWTPAVTPPSRSRSS